MKKNHQIPNDLFNLLPHMHPHVRISPFTPGEWERVLRGKKPGESRAAEGASFWLDHGRDIRFCASGRAALLLCLRNLKLRASDEVLIVKTFDGPYISGCVTQTIEQVCRWSQKASGRTRLVLVIHEFGFPCPAEKALPYQKLGVPVLEDGAYALGSRVAGAKVGTFGDFAMYSLPKYYPVPLGGVLVSKTTPAGAGRQLNVSGRTEKILRQTLAKSIPYLESWNKTRRENWAFFVRRGLPPYLELPGNVVPGVFLARVTKKFPAAAVKTRFNAAGIEATQYYHQGGFYFPVHQFLTDFEKEYIGAHWRLI